MENGSAEIEFDLARGRPATSATRLSKLGVTAKRIRDDMLVLQPIRATVCTAVYALSDRRVFPALYVIPCQLSCPFNSLIGSRLKIVSMTPI